MVHWKSFSVAAERQFASELATLEDIISGRLVVGDMTAKDEKMSGATATQVIPVSLPAPRAIAPEKPSPVKAPPRIEKQPEMIAPVQIAAPPVAAIPAVPQANTPEAALGAILKHEVRENQAKEETFWTPERIQEALKNGAPKSRGAPCIAFCDKNNTEIEINMPPDPTNKP